MQRKEAQFRSDCLPKKQLHAAILALPSVLQSILGEHKIIANYGWATNIHIDLQYIPMVEYTQHLQSFIRDSIDHRIVIPGESDFMFEVPDNRLIVLYCHEGDIHLDGVDDTLLQQFMNTEPFSNMRWHAKQ